MQFSVESRVVSIKAQLDYIFEKVEHDRLLITTQALDPGGKPLFLAPPNKVEENGILTLNISLSATKFLQYEDGILSFEARFDGKVMQLSIPTTLIMTAIALLGNEPQFISEYFMPFTVVEETEEAQEKPEVKKPNLSIVH